MKKRLFSILLCLVLAATLLPAAAMAAGRFTDVTEKDWFYADVEYAVEQGLVDGTTSTTYSPDSNLTYGAAIKLAACMHKKVTQGSTDFIVGSPWYQVYVDYAQANGIIPAGKSYDWNANATRAGYMEIFANAIPDTGLKNGYTGLTAINQVDDGAIPDVSMSHPQAAAIYKLYRAGILQGSDAVTHSCNPNNYIRRSEVATILARMMDASKRISFEMTKPGESASTDAPTTTPQPADALTITQQPEDVNYVAANGRAEFTTAVTGGKGPYTYKWFRSYDDGESWSAIINDSTISGVATKKLTVKLDPSDAYTGTLYRCQISDAANHQATTRSACVTVANTPLTVAEHPVDVTAKSGDEVWFNAFAVGGEAPVLYQWQRKASDGDWQDFPPRNSGYETSRSNSLVLVVSDIDFAAGYSYRCKMTDAAGTTLYTNAAAIRQSGSAAATGTRPTASVMKVTDQPQDVTCKADEWIDFGVGVTGGTAPYTYQWQMYSGTAVDWTDLSNSQYFTGTNTAELRVQVTGQDFQYSIHYRCKITDANGNTVYSDAAAAIEEQSTGTTTRPITRPGTIVRPTTSTPSRPTATSSTLTITVQPKDVTCAVGDTASFTVTVSGGKSPYTYQWQWRSRDEDANWVDLSDYAYVTGAKTNALGVVVMDADFSQGYRYHCVITDADGSSVTSDTVTVIQKTTAASRPNAVISRPSTSTSTDSAGTDSSTPSRPTATVSTSTNDLHITTQPVSTSAAVDTKVTFAVEIAGGKGPYSYQWQYSTDGGESWLPVANSTKYGGVSTAKLTVRIDSTDFASQSLIYRCKISDAAHDVVYSDSVKATYQRPTVTG